MFTIYQSLDSVYPFVQKAQVDVSFISNIRLAVKSQLLEGAKIYVSSIKAKNNEVSISFGSQAIPDIGATTISNTKWGTINNQFIFGFVYIAIMPDFEIEYRKPLALDESTYMYKPKAFSPVILNVNNNDIRLPNLIEIVGQGDIKTQVQQKSIFIKRNSDPCYSFTDTDSPSAFYISSINDHKVQQLVLQLEDIEARIINKNTICLKSKATFPVCKNQENL